MRLFAAAAAMIALPLLSGCVSSEEQAAQDSAFCQSLGATAGNGLMECVMARDEQRENARYRRSMALIAAGNNINQMNQQQAMVNAMNRPVNTTCRRQGIYTNCTSY
ncbi:hypothetical protein [Shinella fusca]|uniref:Lipoprotein n=1 Tax=Shinella fusca TaxID=544480 RepID=A0A7W7YRH4_9HYPH|nr:hypothetical protein [Shinella fusca]MBB5040800.1 hypothetical protein [Shinella fusca]